MQCNHIFYCELNDLIKSLKKYKNHLNIYSRNTLNFFVFFMRTKFMIREAKKCLFFFNLDLRGVMEKCVDCFLVYPFYGVFFISFFLKKKVLRDEGSSFTITLSQIAAYNTTNIHKKFLRTFGWIDELFGLAFPF